MEGTKRPPNKPLGATNGVILEGRRGGCNYAKTPLRQTCPQDQQARQSTWFIRGWSDKVHRCVGAALCFFGFLQVAEKKK